MKLLNKKGGAFDWLELTSDGYLQKARIAIARKGYKWTVLFSREFLNFAVLHELINVSGAYVDQVDGPLDSILNDGGQTHHAQRYSPLDLKVLEILYSPFIKPDMNPNQIKNRIILVNK